MIGRFIGVGVKRCIKMKSNFEKNLGEQPLAKIMAEHAIKGSKEHGLKAQDLVSISEEQITHKMIARAKKGRRLTLRVQCKILNVLNKVTGKNYLLKDLFNY